MPWTLLCLFIAALPRAPIQSVADSNWCMSANERNQGTAIPCNSRTDPWQRHGYELRLNGKCLDNSNNGMEDGNPVLMWPCHGGPNQRWVLHDQQIQLLQTTKCVTANEDSAAAGVLVITNCDTSAAQKWKWPAAWNAETKPAKGNGWVYNTGKYPTSFVDNTRFTRQEFISDPHYLATCKERCKSNNACMGFFEQTLLCPDPIARDNKTDPEQDPGKGCHRVCGFYDRGDNPILGHPSVGPAGSIWIKQEVFAKEHVQSPETFFDGGYGITP